MVRLLLFTAWVLGAPSLAFQVLAPTDAESAGPAMLVFILSPALAGFVLSRGLPGQPSTTNAQKLRGVGLAFVVTLTTILLSTGAAVALGALVRGTPAAGAGAAIASAFITSTLEELGWAAGGLAIVRAALPERVAIPTLGVVWACWHLVIAAFAPPEVAIGMFPLGTPFALALAGFVLGCVALRLLLTELRDRAGTVWAAAVGHVVGNVLLGALLGSGVLAFSPDGPWWAFPGPTGLVFFTLTMMAWRLVRRAR